MMRYRFLLSVLLTLPLWTVLAGCLGYRPPSIAVGEAVLVEETSEALRLDVALDLVNPNNEPLELLQFEYAFSIDGASVFRAKQSAEATLSASGRKRLVLPAVVPLERAPWPEGARPAEAAWSIRGSLLYVTPGALAEALLDTGVRKPRAGFGGSGRVRLEGEAPAR
jgi:hypothetical protein